jgi:hypothetical protein
MHVKALTSLIAISGGTYSENTTTFGVSILRLLDADPMTDHKGLIRSSYGALVVLRAILHMLKHAPEDVKHVVVSKEKYIRDTLTPSSDLYGWDSSGTPKRADVAIPEYAALKELSDKGRFEFIFLPDKMAKYRRPYSVAIEFAKHTRMRAEHLGLKLEAGRELWDIQLDHVEGKR